MGKESAIRTKILSPDLPPREVEIELDGDGVYSLFIRSVKRSLEDELRNGIKLTDEVKRGPGGKLRSRRELHDVLMSMGRDNRRFIEALNAPEENTIFVIHTDVDGQPLAVSLPEQRKFNTPKKNLTKV